jgi:hypothetical protein
MNQPTLIDMPRGSSGMVSLAKISPCGTYRYRLTRVWDGTKPRMVFIMLNPSTADAIDDDATIVRCINRARREGCGSIDVVNLFALRSTDPKALRTHPDPVGPENDYHLLSVLTMTPRFVIAAWGANRFARPRAKHVQTLLAAPLAEIRRGLTCLAVNQDGSPKHPLYVRADATIKRLEVRR